MLRKRGYAGNRGAPIPWPRSSRKPPVIYIYIYIYICFPISLFVIADYPLHRLDETKRTLRSLYHGEVGRQVAGREVFFDILCTTRLRFSAAVLTVAAEDRDTFDVWYLHVKVAELRITRNPQGPRPFNLKNIFY